MSTDRSQAMTQDQITAYLMKRMFRYSERYKLQGALSQDNIQAYLEFVRGTVANTFAKAQLDILDVDDFVDLVEPIVTEMSAKEALTEEKRAAYLQKIKWQAEQYVSERQTNSVSSDESVKEAEESVALGNPVSEDIDPFLIQELIPIGFEKGAPRISIQAFFEFPFGKEGRKEAENFAQHMRYLEEVVGRGGLDAGELSKIKSMTLTLPVLSYRKYYDIYPFNQFDETILLVTFSLWQNKVLNTLLVTEEMES